jgi:hypothetical protein
MVLARAVNMVGSHSSAAVAGVAAARVNGWLMTLPLLMISLSLSLLLQPVFLPDLPLLLTLPDCTLMLSSSWRTAGS